MPRDHSPARQAAMTAVMWLILAGTVGLAELATRHPAQPQLVPTEDMEQLDRFLHNLRKMTTQPG